MKSRLSDLAEKIQTTIRKMRNRLKEKKEDLEKLKEKREQLRQIEEKNKKPNPI